MQEFAACGSMFLVWVMITAKIIANSISPMGESAQSYVESTTDKGHGSNVNYAWLYRTLTGCLHAAAMAAVSMLVQVRPPMHSILPVATVERTQPLSFSWRLSLSQRFLPIRYLYHNFGENEYSEIVNNCSLFQS